MSFSPSVFLVPVIAILTVIFTIFILRGPKKNEHYSKLDRAGIVTNVILALLYIPISMIGFFSVFAFDNPPAGAVASLTTLVNLGISLPIVSSIQHPFQKIGPLCSQLLCAVYSSHPVYHNGNWIYVNLIY